MKMPMQSESMGITERTKTSDHRIRARSLVTCLGFTKSKRTDESMMIQKKQTISGSK